MQVFSHLDDISLWSASRVCRRWTTIVSQSVSNDQWLQFTSRRWPLFRPNYSVVAASGGWSSIFAQLVESSACLYCLHRTRVESVVLEESAVGAAEGGGAVAAAWDNGGGPSHTHNHWRNNRLFNEWRMLSTDPPEGIRATPLDKAWTHWQASITGPTSSPYVSHLFSILLHFTHF